MKHGMRAPRARGWKSCGTTSLPNTKRHFPAEAAEFERRTKGELPANWAEHAAKAIAQINEKGETIATRKASQNAINALVPALPEFLGGSADLTGSNLTNWTGAHHVSGKKPGNYISYGVREFGMAHIMNGMALHGGSAAVRRHLPDVLRICAQCLAHVGADEAARDLCVHP